jgi:hypothetical protein
MLGGDRWMSAHDIIVGVVATLIAAWSLVLLPRIWRGYLTRKETRFRGQLRTHGYLGLIWWPFGEATRRGAVRASPAATLWWCGLTVFYWASVLSAGQAGSRVWHVVAWVSAASALVWFALILTVMFFNKPKFVVPPSQRNDPGAVAEWRSNRRRPRS